MNNFICDVLQPGKTHILGCVGCLNKESIGKDLVEDPVLLVDLGREFKEVGFALIWDRVNPTIVCLHKPYLQGGKLKLE